MTRKPLDQGGAELVAIAMMIDDIHEWNLFG